MKYVGNSLDLGQAELTSPSFEKLGLAPPDPTEGQFYYDLLTKIPYYFDGTQWKPMWNAGGSTQTATEYSTTISAWIPSFGIYYADVVHSLNSADIAVETYSIITGKTVGMEDLERLSINTLRVWSATNTEDIRVTVFVMTSIKYAQTISTWLGSPGSYYQDLPHNLGTKDFQIECFGVTSGKSVGVDELERIDLNTLRVWSATNTEDIRALILTKVLHRVTSVISTWQGTPDNYYGDFQHGLGTNDFIVQASTPSNNKTVGMLEFERLDVNTLRVYSASNSEPVRVVLGSS